MLQRISAYRKQNIEKRMKKNKESIMDIWDNIKPTNIHIIDTPEGLPWWLRW